MINYSKICGTHGQICSSQHFYYFYKSADNKSAISGFIRPPATHWSGTVVDFSYGRNVAPVSVSVGAPGLSDHRMTVCDWSWE